jgi:hypothetical protein
MHARHSADNALRVLRIKGSWHAFLTATTARCIATLQLGRAEKRVYRAFRRMHARHSADNAGKEPPPHTLYAPWRRPRHVSVAQINVVCPRFTRTSTEESKFLLNPAVGRVVGASACGAIVVGSARKRSLLQLRHRSRWVNGEIGHSPVSIQLPGDESAVN